MAARRKSPGKRYKGAESLAKLLTDAAEKKGLSQSELARETERRWPGRGRTQQSISCLLRGQDQKKDSKGRIQPYFGDKAPRDGDLTLLEMVQEILKIPNRDVREALANDTFAWSIERGVRQNEDREDRWGGSSKAKSPDKPKAPPSKGSSRKPQVKTQNTESEDVVVAMPDPEDIRFERSIWRGRLKRKKASGEPRW